MELLVTDSTKNQDEIKSLMQCYLTDNELSDYEAKLRDSDENTRIKVGINTAHTSWNDDDKKKAIIAARYLNSVGKGENALELAYALEENKKKDPPELFNVPDYIKEAIEWICQ